METEAETKEEFFSVHGDWETLQYFKREVRKFGWKFIHSPNDKGNGYTNLYFNVRGDAGKLSPGEFWFSHCEKSIDITTRTNFAKAKKLAKEKYPNNPCTPY